MPAVPQHMYNQGSQPTCFDKMKYGECRTILKELKNQCFHFNVGFTIGFCVGMASGALFGGFSALRYAQKFF